MSEIIDELEDEICAFSKMISGEAVTARQISSSMAAVMSVYSNLGKLGDYTHTTHRDVEKYLITLRDHGVLTSHETGMYMLYFNKTLDHGHPDPGVIDSIRDSIFIYMMGLPKQLENKFVATHVEEKRR